jgi:hypothetical protein
LSSNLNATLLPDLVVTVMLLDNAGSINVNITTADDYNNVKGMTKFRPPYVANYTTFSEHTGTVTKSLMDFFNIISNPFSY